MSTTYKIKDLKEIRKIYNPSDKELEIRKFVYDRFESMKEKRADFDKNWDSFMKAWDGYRGPKGSDEWKSNIFIPMTTSVIEAMLAELSSQELKPWALPRGSEDEGKAQVMNAILEYTWDLAKSDVALMAIIKDALIFGTGIGQEYYWKQPRTVKTDKGTEKKVFEYDDCYLEPVKLEDFYVDERARGFSGPYGARDAIRRYIMDINDFQDFFTGETWDPFGAAKFVKPGGDTNYYEFYKPPERLDHSHEVEVLWYWNKPEDLLAIVANDVLVKSGPNPFKHKQLPFVRVVDTIVPHQFYGKGQPATLDSLQEETNTLRRMIIDRNHLDIDKPILVSDTLTMEDEDAIARPHGIIPVGDVNEAKPLEYSDIPLSVFKSLEMLTEDKVRVTGIDERQLSVQKSGTATEAAILKEATLKRLGMKILQIKNDTLVDLGRLRVSNILQYYSQPKLEEVIGKDAVDKAQLQGVLVVKDGKNYSKKYRSIRLEDKKVQINDKTGSPEVISSKGVSFFEAKPDFYLPTHGGYDIRYKATSDIPISKPLEQQKADEMYDRLVTNPSVDQWKLAEFLIKSRDKNPDDFKSQPAQDQPSGQIDVQKMIDLAGIENDEMMRGNAVGPTPYASPVHTEQHIAFLNSEKFKTEVSPEDSDEILQLFSNHVMGEVMAQRVRSGGMNMMGQQGQMGGEAPSGGAPPPGNMAAAVPGRIQGGNEVPSGVQGPQSGLTGK